MSPKSVIAIVLIVIGIVILAFAGITFKTPGKPIQILNFRIATTETHFIPPLVGALSMTAGLALLLIKGRKPV